MSDETHVALAYLSRVAEPPCPELAHLVTRLGPVEAAGRVKSGDVAAELARRTEARREIDTATKDLDLLARRGGRLITADDAEWPLLSFTSFRGVDHRLRPQAHPPLALWAIGSARLDDMAQRAVAIVGTRASTAYVSVVT